MSQYEETLVAHVGMYGKGLERGMVREHVFAPPRRWRFDLAWPDLKLAVEVEGATWVHGRHARGSGFEKDAEKYNEAGLLGWLVLRVTADMVVDGRALTYVIRGVIARREIVSAGT